MKRKRTFSEIILTAKCEWAVREAVSPLTAVAASVHYSDLAPSPDDDFNDPRPPPRRRKGLSLKLLKREWKRVELTLIPVRPRHLTKVIPAPVYYAD